MSYFSDETIAEEIRRNDAFNAVCALREALSLAKRNPNMLSYKRTFDYLDNISPETSEEVKKLLTKRNESDVVKYYKQIAVNLFKKTGIEQNPAELIKEEIQKNKSLLDIESTNVSITKRIMELEIALDYFEPDEISENMLLNHDFALALKFDKISKPIYEDEKLKDYKLADDRMLRLRFLHPDKSERILGADLIYEQFDLRLNKVRFVHLQYKTWDENVLYFSSGSLSAQMKKISSHLCKSGLCNGDDGNNVASEYRLPFCSGFLRPTSKLTKPDSKLITSGIHIPVCVTQILEKRDKKITKENSKENSVGFKIFEELFLNNLLGSRWISFDELEKFYSEKGIASQIGRVRIHAQEVISENSKDNPF